MRSGSRRAKRRARRFVGWLLVLAVVVGGAFALVALYDRGYIRPNDPSLQDYPVRGVDVSSFQGAIDWPAMARSGSLSFAFIKATEGGRTRDKRFLQNWAEAKGLVARAAYHFFSFCSSGAEQARNFLGYLPASGGELPPGVDVEFTGNCKDYPPFATVAQQLQIFLNAVQNATGKKPIIYVNRTSYDRIIAGHISGYPLWIREVITGPPVGDYPGVTFWQYAGNGRIDGVQKLVDLDAFIGTKDQFERLLHR